MIKNMLENNLNRIFSIGLTAVFLTAGFLMFAGTASADMTVITSSDLVAAAATSTVGVVIDLGQNITLTAPLVLSNAAKTINLNGYSLTVTGYPTITVNADDSVLMNNSTTPGGIIGDTAALTGTGKRFSVVDVAFSGALTTSNTTPLLADNISFSGGSVALAVTSTNPAKQFDGTALTAAITPGTGTAFKNLTITGAVTASNAATYDHVVFTGAVTASTAVSTFTNCTFNAAFTTADVATVVTPGNTFHAVTNTSGNSNYTGAIFNGPVTNTLGDANYTNAVFNNSLTVTAGSPIFSATLKASSTVKGQTVTDLGTSATSTIGIIPGSVTISAAKAADITGGAGFVTLFDKNNGTTETVKAVKYATGATPSVSDITAAAGYANEAITNQDFFIIKATVGTAIMYYKVIVTVAADVSVTKTVSVPATTGFTLGLAPSVAGLVVGDFTLLNGTTTVAIVSATTTDSGATYVVAATLAAGTTYTVNVVKTGYAFGTAANVAVPAAVSAVGLGTAGDYAILAKTGISTTGVTSINGNIGVSPIAATAITGFGQVMDASNLFSKSALVNGNVYAPGYAEPTPTNLTTAVHDMEAAYTDAAARTNPTATELDGGNISGDTIYPGLYKWSTGVTINTGVTLDCQSNASAIFIFQIAQDLTVGNGAVVTLSNGCLASNIFWQVTGTTTLGTTSVFSGNILDLKNIAMQLGATLNGRALAQTAVTLIANTVSTPTVSSLASIAIATPATNLSYTVGDSLDISGLTVVGTYSDNSTSTESITSANVTGFDSSAPATGQTLTITYGGKTKTYTVNVLCAVTSVFNGTVSSSSCAITCYSGYTLSGSTCIRSSGSSGGGGGGWAVGHGSAPVAPVASMNRAQVIAAISQIQTLIASLRAQLAVMTGKKIPFGSLSNPLGLKITSLLRSGMKSSDVQLLQSFLKSQGMDIYPDGLVSGYFGPATLAAVQRFQVKYGIVNSGGAGYGFVGPMTRAKINALSGM